MTLVIAVALVLGQFPPGVPTPAQCRAPSAPALDHAIIAVNNLSSAEQAFRAAGFTIKTGRLHANGLLNRHIKFRDGTEIELMTVQGSPTDGTARRYRKLADAGDGGVYVALKVHDAAAIERAATSLGLRTRYSWSGPWKFLSFVDGSPAAAVFFTSGEATVADADSIFTHDPQVTSLAEVWIEGGAQLARLLTRAGAVSCERARGPDGITGERYALARGSIVVLPLRANVRPRVIGAVLDTPARDTSLIRPIPQFWIRYR